MTPVQETVRILQVNERFVKGVGGIVVCTRQARNLHGVFCLG